MRRRNRTEQRWRWTLAGGALVLAVVVALLEALRRAVRDVDAAVDRVWTAGKRLAQNTQAAHQLHDTKGRTGALRDGLERGAS